MAFKVLTFYLNNDEIHILRSLILVKFNSEVRNDHEETERRKMALYIIMKHC